MKPHDIAVRELEAAGYECVRHGKHDQYRNAALRKTIPLKRHDFDEDDLRYVRKEIQRNKGI